jgi:hypothetical protein
MKWKIFSLIFLASTCWAESTKTTFNPFTGKLDFITKLDSTTVPSGSSNYIQNTPPQAQNASMNITGSATIASTSSFTPSVVSTQAFTVKDTGGNYIFRVDNTPAVSTDTLFGVTASTSTTWALGVATDTVTGPWALHVSSAGWVNLLGSDAPPNSQALCLLAGALGHCTSVVGIGGGCTCVTP